MNSIKKWVTACVAGISLIAMTAPTYAATYTIKENDTLWKIAKTHQISLESLMGVNKQVKPTNLQVGDLIHLPESSASITAVQGSSIPPYSKELTVSSTAYTSAECAVDYFGNPLKLGTVAVDPSVIPLGSKVYIKGYSFAGLPQGGMYATATDIGGSIKGNRVDVYVPTTQAKASEYGIQKIEVYVLK